MNTTRYSSRKGLRYLLGALLLFAVSPAWAQYGTGVVQQVPYVTPGTITLDGKADEAAWQTAPELDLTQGWNSGYYTDCAPNGTEGGVDITSDARLLFTDGALFVHISVQGYQPFWFGVPGTPHDGEQLLVGVDLTHAGDGQVDDTYSGWPDNAPNLGPTTYKISGAPDVGITSNWGYSGAPSPADSGWVEGVVFVDNDNFVWGIEMAIYGDEIAKGGEIGFNAGGAAAAEACEIARGDGAYAYYSWQARSAGSAGGDVMNSAASFATLKLVETVARELVERPDLAMLGVASPNPFGTSTTLSYTLMKPGMVHLGVYDVLGREVATLVDGFRAAGADAVTWSTPDAPAGLYVMQLRVDGVPAGSQMVHLVR